LRAVIRVLLICLLVAPAWVPGALAQSAHPSLPDKDQLSTPYKLLKQSLDESLAVERQQLDNLQDQLRRVRDYEELSRERLDAYRIQLSAHRNILVLPTMADYELQEARNKHLATLNKISERSTELTEKMVSLRELRVNTENKLNSYKQQKKEIEQETSLPGTVASVEEKFVTLIELLSTQQEVLNNIEAIYGRLLERTRQIQSEYEEVATLFTRQIEARAEKRLLKRTVNPFSQAGVEQIQLEAARLAGKIKRFFSVSYWRDISVSDPQAYTWFVLAFFLLFAALETVLAFCRRFCRRVRDKCKEKGYFWQYLTIRLIRRTLFLAGAILFIHFFPVKPAYAYTPLFISLNLLAKALVIVLMARWGINFLHVLWADTQEAFYRFLHNYLKTLLYGIMIFGVLYYILEAGLCETCVLLVMSRVGFELGLLAWTVVFWHRFRNYSKSAPISETRWFSYLSPLMPAVGYSLVLVGLFFEVIGFGAMASYWYTSLARMAAVALWVGALYMVLREISPTGPGEDVEEESLPPGEEKPTPIRWLLIRLSKIALLVVAVLGVPMAWGARETFLKEFFFALNRQINLGEMQISVLDLAVAVLIVLLTHTVVIVWKALLKEKVLAHREMEQGLKDSITTITGYLGWVIGLIIVFRVIGISAASLAVLFGAVGIGLGFGLQNIFNNFLSGIILLFERPIQVGDVIEINGIWGTVAKINVRATQIKTYDNADLIIPNSDFISRQVTNWSFKDARVRRTITVGVAYGSNTELVREVLYDIAANNATVYRRPQPEVLFSDFGENALIFKLRVWAHINYFLTVETDLRFEIDEQFRELGIHIPFPQRDVHVDGGNFSSAGDSSAE